MTSDSFPGRNEWDAAAENYAGTTEGVTSQFVDRLLDVTEVGSDDSVLDVACGTGAASIAAAKRGATLTALDFSAEMLSVLRGRLVETHATRVKTVEGDALQMQLEDASFSAAISNFGVILCPDVRRAMSEMLNDHLDGRQSRSSYQEA